MVSKIEVAISVDESENAKGELLENLCKKVLSAMQYDVTQRVRLTGLEVDLLATHRITKETVFVECKAHNSSIQSDVINKLLGSVEIKDVSAGWLMITSELGKEAKGLWHEWQNKETEKRRKLQIYEPETLLTLLIDNNHIIDPQKMNVTAGYSFSDNPLLLITTFGYFWIHRILNNDLGITESVMAFNAQTGKTIVEQNTVENLSKLISSISDLMIITDYSGKKAPENELAHEAQSIVKVPSGDAWDDYRPARPQDFVGRIKLIR